MNNVDFLLGVGKNLPSFQLKKPEGQNQKTQSSKNEASLRGVSYKKKLLGEVQPVTLEITHLVGGFNPSEKYWSNWIISPNRDENKKYLKPPSSHIYNSLSNSLSLFGTL